MSKSNQRQYHTYPFIDRRFQFVTAFLFVMVAMVNALFFSLLFFVNLRESFFHGASTIPASLLSENLFNQQLGIWFKMMIYVAVPEAVLILLFALFFTHRVSGPIQGLVIRLNEMADGKVPALMNTRKFYFLGHLTQQLNSTIAAFEERNKVLHQAQSAAEAGNLETTKEHLERALRPTSA